MAGHTVTERVVTLDGTGEREETLLDSVLTIKPTPRVERLRERYLSLEHELSIYCAYFVRLNKPLQNGIIARTEHRL